LFTTKGFIKIAHANNKMTFRPIDETCTCYTCQNFTRAYLHHLFKAAELSAYTLATIHNLHFMVQLMAHYRSKILNNEL
jgi:queuine tRNA-ribosyltransferase